MWGASISLLRRKSVSGSRLRKQFCFSSIQKTISFVFWDKLFCLCSLLRRKSVSGSRSASEQKLEKNIKDLMGCGGKPPKRGFAYAKPVIVFLYQTWFGNQVLYRYYQCILLLRCVGTLGFQCLIDLGV